jgi:hypothetical protein
MPNKIPSEKIGHWDLGFGWSLDIGAWDLFRLIGVYVIIIANV